MGLTKAIKEIRKFGIYEVVYHICYVLTESFYYKTKMLIEKDKYYRNLTQAQLKNELEEQYIRIMKEEIHIDKPINFNQKIQWLKIYDNLPIKTLLSDKYSVRKWIADKIGEEYLISLLGAWNSFDEIDFASLPDKFCLKANNGCGMNFVIKDKSSINFNKMRKQIELWLICPFYAQTLELQYKNINTMILAEEYIENSGGGISSTIKFIALKANLSLFK